MPQAPPASIDRPGSTEVAQATLYPFVYVFGSGVASLTVSAAPFPARVGRGCSGGCAAAVWAFYHPKGGREAVGRASSRKHVEVRSGLHPTARSALRRRA